MTPRKQAFLPIIAHRKRGFGKHAKQQTHKLLARLSDHEKGIVMEEIGMKIVDRAFERAQHIVKSSAMAASVARAKALKALGIVGAKESPEIQTALEWKGEIETIRMFNIGCGPISFPFRARLPK